MLLIIVSLTLVCCVLSLWYIERRRKYEDIEKIPGPPTKLLTGNAHLLGNDVVESFVNSQKIIKEYGPIVRIWQGPFLLNLFLTDPDHVEFFLSSNIHIKKSVGYDLFSPWLGQGLINSTGEHWKKHRKILTPAFHFKILEQFTDFFHRESTILIEKLKEHDGKTIDIYPLVLLYAMDTLCESSMNITTECQKNCDDKYMCAAKVFLEIHTRRFFSILKRYDFFFQFTSDYKPHEENIAIMQNISRAVIQKRKKELLNIDNDKFEDECGIKKKKVFLDILLESKDLTDEEIREEVDTFMFAGHDTITSATSFIIYELAKHADIQEKVLQEIFDVVGIDCNEEIRLRQFKELNYLDRVVKEVMRIFPTVPLLEREVAEDITLGGYRIPKGTTVSFHPFAQHRNEKMFSDPEKFDPDRFLPENIIKRHPFAYIPFSAGPRNCIGQKYALMNVKAVVANIIRNFKLFPSETPHQPILGNDSILKSMNGLPVKFIYRK